MKHKKILFVLMVCVLLIAAHTVSAATTRVLFYETKTSTKYKINADYIKFKEDLEANGYSVERYEKDLSREALNSYDPNVLVIPELSKDLTAEERAAIFEFVMHKGRGLFILGGGCGTKGTCYANQITIPFGMSIDEGGMLENEEKPVWDSSKGSALKDKDAKTYFVVEKVYDTWMNDPDPTLRLLVQGVNNLAVFGGNGITLSGDAKAVASGDYNTYAPGSSAFPKGSNPPVAAAAIVGKGLVFLLSDPDMLTKDKTDTAKYKYDNMRFGMNIIDWLRTTKYSRNYTSVAELEVVVDQLDSDKDELYNETLELKDVIAQRDAMVADLETQLEEMTVERDSLAAQTDPLLKINYTTWAIAFLGFVILLLAVNMAGKKKKEATKGSGGADEIGGFGYEFDSGGGDKSAFGANAEGFEELMKMDEPKKKA